MRSARSYAFSPTNGKPFVTPSQAYDCALIERGGLLAYDYYKLISVTMRLRKLCRGAAGLYVQQHFYRNPLIKLHPH
jgi:hypothetical protein